MFLVSPGAIPGRAAAMLLLGVAACASNPIVVERVNAGCSTAGPEQGLFSVREAKETLSEAARVARDCSLETGTAKGKAYVVFTPAGCAGEVKLSLLDELSPADTECVANAFLAARVSAFAGNRVTVAKALHSAE